MEEVARIVLALEAPEVAEEVMHFLDRTGRTRVVGTAVDGTQLAEAIRQLEPDIVVAGPTLVGARDGMNGSGLLVVDTSQSVGTLRRAIRAGAAGFYLWPAEREELGLAAGRVHAPQPDDRSGRARIVAVYGPRGGTGTTFVATHLAASLATRERRCVLVDLDMAFADLTSAIGVPSDEQVRTIAELGPLADELSPRHLEEVLWHHPRGFDVLLAPDAGPTVAGSGAHTYRRAIDAAARICEVVVLHVPRTLDEVARAGLELSDRVLIVLGLDVLSFKDAKRAIAAADLEGRCSFVVNRAARSTITPRDVERVFGQRPVAVIPADRRVAAAQDRGRLLPMRGRLGRAVDRLARAMVEEHP